MWFPIGIFQSPNFSLRESSKKKFDTASSRVYHSSLTNASTARFDFVVTMFREGKIDEDTVDCPRFVAFKGASREDSSSSFNLRQLTKRIHGQSDEFDEEEARQAQRKDRRRRAPFIWSRHWVHIHLKPTSMCGINVVGGGGGMVPWWLTHEPISYPSHNINRLFSSSAWLPISFRYEGVLWKQMETGKWVGRFGVFSRHKTL